MGTSLLNSGGNNGGFLFQRNKYKEDGKVMEDFRHDVYALNLSPRIGYFLADGLMAGLRLNLEYVNNEFEYYGEVEKTEISGVLGGPFVRYYFNSKGEGRVKPYLEAEGMAGRYVEDYGGESKDKLDFYHVGGGAGIAMLLSKHVSFDVMAAYGYWVSQDPDSEWNEKDISSNVGLSLGFSYFLSK
ncbi:MAG: hypothetical protein RI973_2181 [Bacteroidota bacterium]